ncbi:amidohydrolase family protein [Nostoc sp. C117]|uniref:amidohydrolase family protein n=1 Tax=Nostoc sp. C117 TaxID=3349875 RepID=UPI00370DD271
MKIFDFNLHLPVVQGKDVHNVIEQDMSLSLEDLYKGFKIHYPVFQELAGANFMLFNQELLQGSLKNFHELCTAKLAYTILTTLIDFRRQDIVPYIEKAIAEKVRAIMFNSYLQKITESDFQDVLRVCQFAEANKMLICIDASYGTSKMYSYDNMKLACFIADFVSRVPIVIIHSGGYRILEAMLLALDKHNIYLDTSFSLPYYVGSSLEQDYAFAYKKIGVHRILFGSDHPYVPFSEALIQHLQFFEKYKFTESEIEQVMYYTAINLLHENT